jgi:hypothetical protein
MASETDIIITWNETLEDYMADLAERSQGLAWLHSKAEALYSSRRNFIDLPVICLSSLVGFFSVGSGVMFKGQEELSSIVLGVVSLITGVINTFGTYFSFSKKAENHRVASISYGKLYRWLSLELSLPRSQRVQPNDLLKMVRNEYERLQETSNQVPPEIISLFNAKFKDDKEISHPAECNGLEKVVVYDEKTITTPILKRLGSFGRGAEAKPKPPETPPPSPPTTEV